MLREIPQPRDPRLLVGSASADDAGIYRLDAKLALVQTVDFFTPVVDDPYLYGQIAAANALSDVYAMGGRPLTALNVVGMPMDKVPEKVIGTILKGGAAKVKEAGCALIGGHSIRNPEPIYGLSVTGLVHPRRLITNARARPGDRLVLTKPLGIGVVTTAIKRGLAPPGLIRKAVAVMLKLNSPGADLAERGWVRAGTDVTGFGLLGHLLTLCRASGVGAEIETARVPVIDPRVWSLIETDCVPGGSRENLRAAESFLKGKGVPASWKTLLADAQTSGGLLLCVSQRNLARVLETLARHRSFCAAVIGTIVASPRTRILLR